jgi:FdhE protein
VDPKSLLDRWLSKPEPSPGLVSALGDLERLGRDRPELAGPSRTLGLLLIEAFDGHRPGAIDEAAWEAMRASWSRGEPSFRAYLPTIDPTKLASRLRRVLGTLGPEVATAGAFAKAIRAKRLDPRAWVAEVLAGRPEEVERQARELGIDPTLATSTLRLALLPSLAPISARLDPMRTERAWERGDCPHCGSRPLLAESRGLEQRIHYRCGLCAADWPGERLRCPSCGEVDSRSLHYSFVEGEQDRSRLAHCDACRYDWKVVSTLTALTSPAMIVADLATVHLDLLAADRREIVG